MAQRKASFSRTTRVQSPTVAMADDVPDAEAEKWIAQWACVLAKDLIDVRIVEVDADMSVEDACDLLLQEDIPCLAVRTLPDPTRTGAPYLGLFDFSDVNAFLTLAATRHTIPLAELRANSRADQIMSAAREGRVPVHLVSNLSEKNHLETLPNDASLISLLGVFAKGTHRVLVEAVPPNAPAECNTAPETTKTTTTYLGAVSDRALLAYFANFAMQSDTAHIHSPMQYPHSPRSPISMQPSIQISQPSQSPKLVSALTASRPSALPQPPSSTFTFATLLSCPLHLFAIPSLQVYTSVIAATSSSTVLDAMRLMSDCGVSSVAVVDDGGGGYGAGYGSWGGLIGAVSVTDIGKLVVPSQSKHILSAPLHQFVAQIKEPDGSTDGADRYPVYVALPSSTLSYAIQKLLATNSHRLFVIDSDFEPSSSPGSPMGSGLCGIVSVVDILSLFARIANVPDVDPTQRMRHRRASSTSSHSSSLNIVRELSRSGSLSQSSRDFAHSRSNSRTSIRLSQSPRVVPIADVSSPRLVSSLGLGDIRDSPRMAPTLGAGDRNSVGLDLGELMGRWE
jgi:CBS domain-containing protein